MADENKDTYQVVAPLACLKDRAGKLHYLYFGAPVVIELESDEYRDRMVSRGLIAKVVKAETEQPGEVQANQLDPSDILSRPVAEPTETQAESEVTPAPEQIERPAVVASKDVWEDYAIKRGMAPERAKSLSKREIQDAYPVDVR